MSWIRKMHGSLLRTGEYADSGRRGCVIVTGLTRWRNTNEGVILAKRAFNTGTNAAAEKGNRGPKSVERERVPIEDDPKAGERASEGVTETAESGAAAKPSMQEVFGPGGFLE